MVMDSTPLLADAHNSGSSQRFHVRREDGDDNRCRVTTKSLTVTVGQQVLAPRRGALMKQVRKSSKKLQPDRGKGFPGLRGKVVHYVDTSFEEDRLYIHVRFMDRTELCFWLSPRIMIEEATLSDWKTGDDVIKRTYIQSPRSQSNGGTGARFPKNLSPNREGKETAG